MKNLIKKSNAFDWILVLITIPLRIMRALLILIVTFSPLIYVFCFFGSIAGIACTCLLILMISVIAQRRKVTRSNIEDIGILIAMLLFTGVDDYEPI